MPTLEGLEPLGERDQVNGSEIIYTEGEPRRLVLSRAAGESALAGDGNLVGTHELAAQKALELAFEPEPGELAA